VNWMRLA